ncbi:transport protein TonB [Candidatus Termititenax aidoneus]|uniref:Transport protein TonB n=1 Tax=Termititenax aidoneus TaxID=2218524 RepID=A0A388T9H8_TERA1|nr:transport protein TonB [Candidatus Termititenax aidoneus]
MTKYFFISLLIHLLVLVFYLNGRVSADLNNFYFGRQSGEKPSITIGFGAAAAEAADSAGYELIGAAELSSYASPQNRPPKYPALALHNRWQGEAVLLLSINKNGALDRVDLVKSSGHQILDQAALLAAQDWRFQSLRRGIQVNFPVKYVLQN